jgi:capsular polysaccharide biosynthesis protein
MLVLNPSAMTLRFAPYLRLAQRIVRGPGTLESIASDREVLCPEETTENEPPIFLPGQLERVTSGTEHQPLQAEIQSMLTSAYTNRASIAYHIREAAVLDGSVYVKNFRHFIADNKLFKRGEEPRYFKAAGLASTTVGLRYFGHWLRDDCLQYLLAEQTGAALSFSTPAWNHKAKYAAYFGQDWTSTDRAVVDDLVIYQDFAQNSLKLQRYDLLSEKIRATFPGPTSRNKLVFLRRGETGTARLIFDEETLVDFLAKNGFVILDLATDDLDLILRTLLQARLLVSMEGSHVTHCCFTLAQNCGLLVLQPSDRFTAVHRHWAARVHVQFGFVVGVAAASGYKFSDSEILQTVDLMFSR